MNPLHEFSQSVINDLALSTFPSGIIDAFDNFYLSALGGRICYSSESPIDIINTDDRVRDPKTRKRYLDRIKVKHHYSIFAHSPVMILADNHPTGLYKTYPKTIDSGVLEVLNARHFIEYGLDIKVYENGEDEEDFTPNYKVVDLDSLLFTDKEPSRYLLIGNIDLSLPSAGYYVTWIYAIAYRVSRVLTHQLIRHTWFNFSQRSMRYTKAFGVYVPDTLKPLFEDPNFECAQNYDRCYWELIEIYKAKKQDARYFFPMGAYSTIMFSAPVEVFEDFVVKRRDKAAQKEIRDLATAIDMYLEEVRNDLKK